MYTPRSGAVRKIKYALPIYLETALPEGSQQEIARVSKAMQDAEMKASCRYATRSDAERVAGIQQGGSLDLKVANDRTILGPSSSRETFPIPDEEYYKLYTKTMELPPFPVTSCPDATEWSDFADGCTSESEYDMDSEDEEWITANREYHITPARLEYIFTQLNRRNTHVKPTALGALRPPYHKDFHIVFPYWKQKRLQNNNVATWKPRKAVRTEAKPHGHGYVTFDPFRVFSVRPVKTPVLPVKSLQKSYAKGEIQATLDRLMLFKQQSLKLRNVCWAMLLKDEQRRELLVQKSNELKDSNNSMLNDKTSGVSESTPMLCHEDKTNGNDTSVHTNISSCNVNTRSTRRSNHLNTTKDMDTSNFISTSKKRNQSVINNSSREPSEATLQGKSINPNKKGKIRASKENVSKKDCRLQSLTPMKKRKCKPCHGSSRKLQMYNQLTSH